MRWQKRFFTLLALLAVGWIALGVYAQAAAERTIPDSTAGQLGAAAGGAVWLSVFLCTGLPVLVIALFMRWRCAVGLRTQQQHVELIAATKQR